ncbi:hypothetical protein K461DRAFT_310317 [Myriangium duriaei CBS 260.36]|uniref:Uncharacterized protein n=1 Tax=Myriangium duriaei CBS 260.36 TaxID=1168546 RepID=A0A9P4MMY1_9PEZI|nr:hypothetical protein K461DRAFT_310317 [Myriangium duriaei CBS 260.36]
MSSHPQTTTNTRPNRLPAPALFIGPPSAHASHLSLTQPSSPTSRRHPSTPRLTPRHIPHSSTSTGATASTSSPHPPTTAAVAAQPAPSRASLDASFATLQRALDEVEAGAAARTAGRSVSAGGTVFGPDHASALRGLRLAQVRLAEAWGPTGREEIDGEDVGKKKKNKESGEKANAEKEEARDGESELRSAAERRERNELYFADVKRGMLDVVAKLDDIAQAMRRVETEGREIWEDNASLERGGSVRKVS